MPAALWDWSALQQAVAAGTWVEGPAGGMGGWYHRCRPAQRACGFKRWLVRLGWELEAELQVVPLADPSL